jgi:hypothetical protein
MPTLDEHQSPNVVKMLLLGNSGVGKTGAIGSLAAAGYRCFIFDFDNGLDILMDPQVLAPEHRRNIYYRLLQDKPMIAGNALVPQATAWNEFVKYLSAWNEGAEKLGGFMSWGPQDVIVIDSITMLSDAAMNMALLQGGRLGSRPQIQDWGAAMDMIQSTFELLYSGHCKCNVLVTSHITMQGDELAGGRKGMPSVLGQKLAPKIPRYFNNMVLLEKQVVGATVRRQIQTRGTPLVDLKVSKPSLIPAVVEPDLAKLFSVLKGESTYGKV